MRRASLYRTSNTGTSRENRLPPPCGRVPFCPQKEGKDKPCRTNQRQPSDGCYRCLPNPNNVFITCSTMHVEQHEQTYFGMPVINWISEQYIREGDIRKIPLGSLWQDYAARFNIWAVYGERAELMIRLTDWNDFGRYLCVNTPPKGHPIVPPPKRRPTYFSDVTQ